MSDSIQHTNIKLIVTNRGLEPARYLRFELRRAVSGARVRGTGFRAVFAVEADGDPRELAKLVFDECPQSVGHVTAVLATVDSNEESIKDAAVHIGAAEIGPEESFCFRLHKRGAHQLKRDTATLEREIGSAIWTALEAKHNKQPKVNLKNPELMVIAEILGPLAAVGILRKVWREE